MEICLIQVFFVLSEEKQNSNVNQINTPGVIYIKFDDGDGSTAQVCYRNGKSTM